MAGPGEPAAEPDLDVLIGEIRREAARRRAAPDFPLAEEAGIAADMDRQGPIGGGADLASVLSALRRTASGESGVGSPAAELAGLAGLVESVGRALTARVADLERRLDRLAPPLPAPGAAGPPADAGRLPAGLDHWAAVVERMVAAGPAGGRVLAAGPGAGAWVDRLAASGADVYGVDPSLPAHGDAGPVRAGGVAAHLQSVAEDSLGTVVLVGPLAAAELPHLDRWAAALAARTLSVAVLSETPWSWRHRLGPVAADTSPWRPAAPDTWMAVLHDAGFRVTGRFGPEGRDYCVAANRSAGADPSGQ